MTQTQKDEIIAYYNKGYSIEDICILVPLTRAEIAEIVKTYCNKAERQKVARGKQAAIRQAVDDGCHDVQVLSQMFEVSKAYIYKTVNTGRRKPYGDDKSKSRAILSDLQKGGATMAEIARKNGVSRQAVFNVKKKYFKA